MYDTDYRFCISLKVKMEPYKECILSQDYYKANRLYNNAVRFMSVKIKQIKRTKQYNNIIKLLTSKDTSEDKKKELYKEIKNIIKANNLTKYDIEKYMKNGNIQSLGKSIPSDVHATLAKELSKAVENALFKGTKIHYRKFGHTNTLSSKNYKRTIIYNKENNLFKYKNIIFKLKDIREKDYYLYEALENDIAICRIVRKIIKNKHVYYLQIVLKGTPPQKFTKGRGTIGIDQGTSTIAYYKNDLIGFKELAPNIDKYNKEILRIQRKMNRKLALNNPDCYNEDGTIKKGVKFIRSKSYKKELFKLKDIYRKKTIYVQQEHNKLVKFILNNCDTVVKETLDFKALQKRVKGKAKRQDKTSKVIDKKGNLKYIYKFKKKKRFGKSLNNHSPGYLDAQLLKKAEECGVNVVKIDMLKYKASQYNHDTDEYIKASLSDRFKVIDGHKVQRDLYSSFLLSNYKDEENIDRNKCIEEFNNFIRQQDELVKKVTDNTGNFGLKYFA